MWWIPGKLFCAVGLHYWTYGINLSNGKYYKKCTRCGKLVVVTKKDFDVVTKNVKLHK